MDIKKVAADTLSVMVEPMAEYNPKCKDGLDKPHVIWMLNGIILGYVTGEKAHRWLGWAQAVVCAYEYTTLEDLKVINSEGKYAP